MSFALFIKESKSFVFISDNSVANPVSELANASGSLFNNGRIGKILLE